MAKKALTLDRIIPQRANANKHTQRGMRLLETSIGERGWIGAITTAANGEVFDGSARRETVETAGLEEPIIVRTNGRRPVVVVREDIPSADHPMAKQLALEANRIADHNHHYDQEVIGQLRAEGIPVDRLFTAEDMGPLEISIEDDGAEEIREIQSHTCPHCGHTWSEA